MQQSFPRSRALAISALAAVALFGVSLVGQVPAVDAAGAGSAQAKEAVRLINGVRAAAGKSALKIDVYLAKVAADGSIPCPDTSDTIAGRTQDFAAFGQMDHHLRDCSVPSGTYQLSSTAFVDQLRQNMGYSAAAVGEILGENVNYGTGKYQFTYKSWSTYTYSTTGHIVAGWLSSGSHAPIVLGNYNRVGCGAWWQNASTIYYDCIFASGGPAPSGLAAPPTVSPFGGAAPTPAPATTAAPKAPAKTAAATPHATPAPTPTFTPTPAPTATSTPEQTLAASSIVVAPAVVLPAQAATPTTVAAALDTAPDPPRTPASNSLVKAASLSGILLCLTGLGVLVLRRKLGSQG